MKNSGIISAFVGGAFFAVPLLLTPIGILPSLVLGATAFGASELLLGESEKKENVVPTISIPEQLRKAKENNLIIHSMIDKIEDAELREYINNICITTGRIIYTVEMNQHKYKKAETFFDYYLPMAIKIIKRYDEIENQRLNSADSKAFMGNTKSLLKETSKAFEKQLSSLYQSDIVDLDAEMKVFDAMLKSDGLGSNEIDRP